MARPKKNNCDYFPHDAGMRNHTKVKAIRQKFANGYAIWSMLLEYLTGADGNEFENSDMQYELLSGDFGVSVTEIRDVVNYCIRLEMLFDENGFIYSDSLNERLAPVYEKRGKAKELSGKQLRKNGKYVAETPQGAVVTVTETPQRKRKERKGNNIEGVKEVVEFLNLEADTTYNPLLKSSSTFISARLNEGNSVEDLKLVVKLKVKQWAGTDMDKYIRPETLFNSKKFDGYLMEAKRDAKEKIIFDPAKQGREMN